MAEQFEDYEDEFQQSAGGWWIHKIGIIVYLLVVVAYAIQTLQLVNWLFPVDNWFMKLVTVFVCDGCATGYAMAEMFYRFRLRRSKQFSFGMWIVTFALSTAATVIQMYLSSTHNIPHAIDPSIITLAYGLIILAFVVNIIAITVIIRSEYTAAQPDHRYLDDNKLKRRKKGPQPKEASPDESPVQQSRTSVQQVTQASSIDYDQLAQAVIRHTGVLPAVQPTQSPLQQPPLPTSQASQPGNQNGVH